MSKDVPRDQPLSDEDREYLMARGQEQLVAQIDIMYPGEDAEAEADAEPPDGTPPVIVKPYEEWTLAELQDECAARSLSKTGTKAELVLRLQENDKQ